MIDPGHETSDSRVEHQMIPGLCSKDLLSQTGDYSLTSGFLLLNWEIPLVAKQLSLYAF